MLAARLLLDPPADGAWNMAVDEALLDAAAERGAATLRLYQWREPTLSLGYFQRYDERVEHPASAAAPVVRRLTGGGALLHDRELTYSLCLPASHPQSGDWGQLYCLVHLALIGLLAESDVVARRVGDGQIELAATAAAEGAAAGEPFLCFARRTADDVIVAPPAGVREGVKIIGSAQRRRRGAVLQHGAILVGASPLAPELPGLAEATGRRMAPDELADRVAAALAAAANLAARPHPLDEQTREKATELAAQRFRNEEWTRRR